MTDQTTFLQRLRAAAARLVRALKSNLAYTGWGVAFVVLMARVVAVNPAKLDVFNWLAARSIGATLLGVALFHTFDAQKLSELEGIEFAMALTRRMTLICVLILASALLA